jgi:hypothetical protein
VILECGAKWRSISIVTFDLRAIEVEEPERLDWPVTYVYFCSLLKSAYGFGKVDLCLRTFSINRGNICYITPHLSTMKRDLKNFHANAVELLVKYIAHAERLGGAI